MRKTLVICLLLLSLSATSCQPKKAQKYNFNATMPTSFEEYFIDPSSTILTQKNTPTDVWNTEDVDISYIKKDRKLIAFTFDDAPSKTMENILAVFANFNANNPDCPTTATFFLNGNLISKSELPLLYTAQMLGIELGNHTHTHKDLTTLQEEEIRSEIEQTDDILSQIDGKAVHLFRPPFGKIDKRVKSLVEAPIIQWTIDTLDWTGRSADEIYESVYNDLFSGAIVLMHDGYPATVKALTRLLPDLKADGYQVVGVSALAKAHGCALRTGGEYIRARKQT